MSKRQTKTGVASSLVHVGSAGLSSFLVVAHVCARAEASHIHNAESSRQPNPGRQVVRKQSLNTVVCKSIPGCKFKALHVFHVLNFTQAATARPACICKHARGHGACSVSKFL